MATRRMLRAAFFRNHYGFRFSLYEQGSYLYSVYSADTAGRAQITFKKQEKNTLPSKKILCGGTKKKPTAFFKKNNHFARWIRCFFKSPFEPLLIEFLIKQSRILYLGGRFHFPRFKYSAHRSRFIISVERERER